MKKVVTILIFTVMVLGLAACGNKTEPAVREEISAQSTAESTVESDTAATERNTVINGSAGNSEDVMQDADDTLAENRTDEMAEITDSDEDENDAEAQDDTNEQR